MKKLFIVVNHDWFFLSHRKAIAVAALNKGWNVTIVTRNTGRFDDIRSLQDVFLRPIVTCHHVVFGKSSVSYTVS